MSYQEMTDNLVNPAYRGRAEMCIREQGQIYQNDGRADIAALGRGIVGNSWMDIEAIMAAVAAGPNSTPAVTDDGALLAAVQGVWPVVAAARYPGAVAMAASMVAPMSATVPTAASLAPTPPPDAPSPSSRSKK